MVDWFLPAVQKEAAEQNLAFRCVDQEFDGLPHRPDKKSLKQDPKGKYMELSFISPVIGREYQEELQRLADQTGWRIHIAARVDQNALFKNIQMLCMEYGITPAKNPSYLPKQKTIQVKVQEHPGPEKADLLAKEFRRRTGCGCEVETVS